MTQTQDEEGCIVVVSLSVWGVANKGQGTNQSCEWSAGCEKIDRGGQVTPSHSGHVLVTACCVYRHVVMFDDVLTLEYS